MLPNHYDIAKWLCAYDLIGFQTQSDFDGFRDYLLRWAGGEDLGRGAVRAFGRVVRAQVFPIGIDVATVAGKRSGRSAWHFRGCAKPRNPVADDRRRPARLFERLGSPVRSLYAPAGKLPGNPGTDRADPNRAAIALRGPEYQEIREDLASAAGHINSRYGEFDWTPLRYINKSFRHPILTGFFRASRIGLVTPLRDGMNLVAKEYVASQPSDDPGVLVLSCFAGAARELGEAVIVNPFDVEGMAEAIFQGLNMSLGERKERWNAMMAVLERNDITAWRESFVRALSATTARP